MVTENGEIEVEIESEELGQEDLQREGSSTTEPDSDLEDDDPLGEGEGEGDGDVEDSSPADREAIRERRRQERHDRKIRNREEKESLRREIQARDATIDQMRQRLDAIERRNTGSELAQIENAKKEAQQAYNYFKDQISVGTEAKDGRAVADATEKMLIAQQRYQQLDGIERAYRQRKQQPQPLDPRLTTQAERWMKSNRWYDPNGSDMDSKVVLAIDNGLAQEGWDPTTPSYWEELDTRVKKYLPHRGKSGIITSSRPKSVVSGGTQEFSGSKSTFKLSADRVQAMKDMGIWDDVEARNKMIKQYRDYDKQHGKGN